MFPGHHPWEIHDCRNDSTVRIILRQECGEIMPALRFPRLGVRLQSVVIEGHD
jgi:hypothetical protein